MQAVKANNVAQVRQLIASGVDVSAADASGDVPLIMAAYLGHTEITPLLLAARVRKMIHLGSANPLVRHLIDSFGVLYTLNPS
jgi:ankyrin repeat protein